MTYEEVINDARVLEENLLGPYGQPLEKVLKPFLETGDPLLAFTHEFRRLTAEIDRELEDKLHGRYTEFAQPYGPYGTLSVRLARLRALAGMGVALGVVQPTETPEKPAEEPELFDLGLDRSVKVLSNGDRVVDKRLQVPGVVIAPVLMGSGRTGYTVKLELSKDHHPILTRYRDELVFVGRTDEAQSPPAEPIPAGREVQVTDGVEVPR